MGHGLIHKWNEPDTPENWGDAMKVFEEVWDAEKHVRVDKSPPNMFKVEHIAEYFRGREEEVVFFFLSRSPCMVKNGYKQTADLLLQGLDVVRKQNISHM